MKWNAMKIIVLFFIVTSTVYGYELATHGVMTQNAFERVLKDDEQLINRLGMSVIKDNLGDGYYDVSASSIYERKADTFEGKIIKDDLGVQPLSVSGWLMRGAIREDDAKGEDNPQDDEFNPNLKRPLHHFYDPVNDCGLFVNTCEENYIETGDPVFGLFAQDPDVHKAPDWAIGTGDAFTDPNVQEADRRNHFTVFDAREAMFRAITGRKLNPDGTLDASIGLDSDGALRISTEEDRKVYWATTFRALGDVLHLLQDMAQPQHARNDRHAGKFPVGITGHESVYESYINARAKGAMFECFNGGKVDVEAIKYGNYPAPSGFTNYTQFFDSRNGNGLAEYSNRGFFTAGTNFASGKYMSPPSSVQAYDQVYQERTDPCVTKTNKALLFERPVEDSLQSTSSDPVPLTAAGLFRGKTLVGMSQFALVKENYDAMADLLIPRAVAYSAGLINYFFRGRLEITPPDEGIYGIVDHAIDHTSAAAGVNGKPVITEEGDDAGKIYGFNKIKLKLRNATPTIDDGGTLHNQDMTGGTLMAVVKYRLSPCYERDLSGEYNNGNSITPNGCNMISAFNSPEEVIISERINDFSLNSGIMTDIDFDFTVNPIPINATNFYLQVVYRGPLGSEDDAVVVATQDIAEPTYFSYLNSTDYFSLNGTLYKPQTILSTPGLLTQIDANGDGVPDVDINPTTMSGAILSINTSENDLISVSDLDVQHYARVAFLSDYGVVRLGDITPGFKTGIVGGTTARRFQYDAVNDQRIIHTLGTFRGLYYQNISWKVKRYPIDSEAGIPWNMEDIIDPNPGAVTFTY